MSGGLGNEAGSGEGASVSGGARNHALGYESSISGGLLNVASRPVSSVSGGKQVSVSTEYGWAAGAYSTPGLQE